MDNRKKPQKTLRKNSRVGWVQKDNNEKRRNSACGNLGRVQNTVTDLDMKDYYSPCIHRIYITVEEMLGSNKVFL